MKFKNIFRKISTPHQTASVLINQRLYDKSKLTRWLIPSQCILCQSPIKNEHNQHNSLCKPCINSLPRIKEHCSKCSTPLKSGDLCGVCLTTQRHWNRCFAAYEYQDHVKKLIADFKYKQTPSLGALLGDIMQKKILDTYASELPDYLVPVPVFRDRLQSRGFNQSLILCKALSKNLNIPILDILLKTKKTPTQKGLSSKERKLSITNSFQLKHPPLLSPNTRIKKVAIIDDVMTTGSTSSEIAKLLKKSNISDIEVWVLART